MQVKCLDTEEILYSYQDTNQNYVGAFWNQYSNGIGEKNLNLNVKLGGLNEGETVEFSMAFLPEYYNAGKRGENAQYGEGAVASVTAVVDKTLPQVQAIELDAAEKTIHVSAADNQYISAVVLYNASGDEVLTYAGAKQEISPGEKAVFDLDYSNQKDNQFLLQVFDYALNMATYRVTINEEDLVFSGAMYVFNQADGHWAMSGEDAKALTNVSVADAVYNAATSIGGKVFAVNNENELHVLDALDMSVGQFVDKLDYTVNDLAYNTVDGYIYGVSDEKLLIQIEPSTGNQKVIGNLPFVTNTLACDADGNFYSNLYGTGEIYSYTLETVTTDASMDYDFNGDKAVNLADAQYLLDYVTGKIGSISNTELADIDADGDVDTYDAYLLNEAIPHLPELLAVAYSTNSKYLQTMEVDLSSGMLYWASYFTDWMQGDEVAFSYLWSVNLETGEIERHTDFWDQLTSMVIFDVDTSS